MLLPRCPFCLATGACELRWDKRGKPYLSALCCRTRAFLSSLNALAGIALAPSLLDEAVKRGAADPAYQAQLDAAVAKLTTYVRNRGTAPPAPRTNELQVKPAIVPWKVTA
jgi:hypothetical protein